MTAPQILTPEDPRWDDLVGRTDHTFHHLAAYHRLAEAQGDGTARMLVHGDDDTFVAWPHLLSTVPGDAAAVDATSVYGYTGLLAHGAVDDALLADAWAGFRDAWAQQGVVTLFTRFHPVLETSSLAEGFAGAVPTPGGELVSIGRTVSIDCRPDRETRRASYHKELRYDVRRAERDGVAVHHDEAGESLETLVGLYEATMDRNTAGERHRFSIDYFRGLREALGDRAHLACATVGDEIAAVLLFVVEHGHAEAHLTGVDERFLRHSPLKLLIDATVDLSRDLGARELHLGAGRGGGDDPLFDFKARFSPHHHDFVLGRWVLDAAAYRRLCKESGCASTSWFPPYRAETS